MSNDDDKYENERKKGYGKCSTCNRYNTNNSWCQSCDPHLLTQGWTSGNEAIDELIKSTQLKATTYGNYNYLQWIPFEDFKNVEQIGKGGFATIYKATWVNGLKYTNNGKRINKDRIIALKKLLNSQNISEEFLKEFSNYVQCCNSSFIIHIYGITQEPNTKDYIFVMKYLADGSLHDYLSKNFGNLKWVDKINILYKIINGLNDIHQREIVHHDLHSGNILQEKYNHSTYIADLGLSCPANKTDEDCIYGVLPYLAPELFLKKPYTKLSDIYSFGVLMSVVSTGRQPFNNLAHDSGLVIKIVEGLRPSFSNNTPKLYIDLAHKCMNADPNKRPIAREIKGIIDFWRDALHNENHRYSSQEQVDRLRSIKAAFIKMDEVVFDPSATTLTVHPDAVYFSRLLKFSNLPQSVNSEQLNYHDSRQVELVIPDQLT